MEYLGHNAADRTCIYRLSYPEETAFRRLIYALTKTSLAEVTLDTKYQETLDKAIPIMNQLSDLLEKGPVQLSFAPVEVSLDSR